MIYFLGPNMTTPTEVRQKDRSEVSKDIADKIVAMGYDKDRDIYKALEHLRKAYYDRNVDVIVKAYSANVGAGAGGLEGWNYTVPAGRMAMHQILYESVDGAIATAGKQAYANHYIDDNKGGGWVMFSETKTIFGDGNVRVRFLGTITFLLVAGQKIRCYRYNNDTDAHYIHLKSVLSEFDA